MKNGLALYAMVLFLPSLVFGQSSALPLTQRIALPNVDGRMDHMGIDTAGQRLPPGRQVEHRKSVIVEGGGEQPLARGVDAHVIHAPVDVGERDGSVKMFDGKTFQLLQ